MALLLKGARCVDPVAGLDRVCDVLVRDGRIVEIGEEVVMVKGVEVDLSGKVLLPGLFDMHVHLRDPGQEYKESICSGSQAAAAGGFTGVLAMPNTNPVCDDASVVEYIYSRAAEAPYTRVYTSGACTVGLKGQQLAEIASMHAAGAVAFSDDGRGTQDNNMMRLVMDYVHRFDGVVLSHCQCEDLVGKGVVNEGVVSTRLGLEAWPAAGEEIQIARDIALCELTGCRLHIQHITTARGVAMVVDARRRGLPVTCEVTPHHLFLSEDDITDAYETNMKMNPPLRTAEDCAALRDALVRGDIDCVATDHAPHADHEKALEFELAPFGTTGLETAVALMVGNMVLPGVLTWPQLVERMAHAPRRILGLELVTLAAGSIADLTVVDPGASWTVTADGFKSKSHNSAFLGKMLTGRVTDTFVGGYATLRDGQLVTQGQ
jgi:dihydroorotase